MEFYKQLKKYRKLKNISQDQLSSMIFVSRQTISKLENNKAYPDLNSLLSISNLFGVSLDELIKGDVEIMKKKVDKNNLKENTYFMMLFFAVSSFVSMPSIILYGKTGIFIDVIFWIITIIYSFNIERIKRDNSLKKYSEIISFMHEDIACINSAFNNKFFVVLLAFIIVSLLFLLTFSIFIFI
ncbi:helix-turn-helix domain-containing protein [Apilactobacillus micheneri]|uniref:helix-turn-helix domain-containing protein n=1 Tax=Apilactobacillus micheneri TaxID=1899430 RepID=UPI0011266489|nr:helix-turn-helix domain-containing protein [Apilactobacillus micheneri]TPR38991.1 helix-turn-helix domain-containing protein [Apilactobacillus micheneri]